MKAILDILSMIGQKVLKLIHYKIEIWLTENCDLCNNITVCIAMAGNMQDNINIVYTNISDNFGCKKNFNAS